MPPRPYTLFPVRFNFHRIALLAAAALSLAACSASDDSGPSERSAPPATPIAGFEIQPRDLSRQLALSGTVRPRIEISLAARTTGTVEAVSVEEGDTVEKGAVLATLDTSEARAELARAGAEVRAARIEYERTRELRERGMVSAAQYDMARAAYDVAQSEQALWRTRVDFGRIVSPVDGVVTARHVEVGEAVASQDMAFELAAVGELVIRFGVSELDVVHLEPGMTVPLALDARPEVEFSGTIRRVFPQADRMTRLVTVEVALPEDAFERGARPGFLARARWMVDLRPDLLAVPSAAIGRQESMPYVFVVSDGQLEQRFVQTGIVRGPWTEITQGVEAGERILASNPLEMRDGQAVRIVTMQESAR